MLGWLVTAAGVVLLASDLNLRVTMHTARHLAGMCDLLAMVVAHMPLSTRWLSFLQILGRLSTVKLPI